MGVRAAPCKCRVGGASPKHANGSGVSHGSLGCHLVQRPELTAVWFLGSGSGKGKGTEAADISES